MTQAPSLASAPSLAPDVFWFLPSSGDTRYLGRSDFGRAPDPAYLRDIATTAERLGYDGLLIPTGASCLDPVVLAAGLAEVTRRIKLLVALRCSLSGPALAARQAATLDQLLGGRLLLNVVPGGDAAELAAEGVFLDHSQRYENADEFLAIWRRLMAGETVDFDGRYQRIRGGRNLHPPLQRPYPPLYFGGSSPAAHDLAARHVDTYLTWGEPPAAVAAKIADLRARAAAQGRQLRYGLRLHVIARETEAEAWAEADRLISRLSDEDIALAQAHQARMDSVGQARMAALHGGRRDKLVIGPNLWAGVGLVRGGAGTALVGTGEQIAQRLAEYRALGIETFVLSGYPHLEEAIRCAELVFPHLGKARVTQREGLQTGGAFDGRVPDGAPPAPSASALCAEPNSPPRVTADGLATAQP